MVVRNRGSPVGELPRGSEVEGVPAQWKCGRCPPRAVVPALQEQGRHQPHSPLPHSMRGVMLRGVRSEDGASPSGRGPLTRDPSLFNPVEDCPSPRSQACRGRLWYEGGAMWGFIHFPQV